MGIIEFLIIAAVLGLIAWALVSFVPMPQAVKTIIIVAVCLVLVLLLLKATGVLDHDIRIPRISGALQFLDWPPPC